LSPVFDINTVQTGTGLTLNITDEDNSPDTELALEIAEFFRLDTATAKKQLMISKKYTFKLKYRYTFKLISTL